MGSATVVDGTLNPRSRADEVGSMRQPRPMVQVVVLSEVPDRRARLLRLVGPLADTTACQRATDLGPGRYGATVVVADTTGLDLDALGASLDAARQRMGILLVVLVPPFAPAQLHTTLARAARIRSVESVAVDWLDVKPLTRAALQRADALLCAEHVVDAIRDDVPNALLPFVEFCAGRSGTGWNVTAMVEQAGLKRRTLDSRLRRAGLPTAESILGWCRVLRAAWCLDRSTDSVERVALAIGLTSASALRNFYRRYARLSPTAARTSGGFAFLLHAFRAEFVSVENRVGKREIMRG
jgi:AraC-like DNA-binding protein